MPFGLGGAMAGGMPGGMVGAGNLAALRFAGMGGQLGGTVLLVSNLNEEVSATHVTTSHYTSTIYLNHRSLFV